MEVEITAGTVGEAGATHVDEVKLRVSEVHAMRKDGAGREELELVIDGGVGMLCRRV